VCLYLKKRRDARIDTVQMGEDGAAAMYGCSPDVVDGRVYRLSMSLSGVMVDRVSSERISRSRAAERDSGSVCRDDDKEEVGGRQVMATTAGDDAGKRQLGLRRVYSLLAKGLLAI
jgi:hypothetical protein